MQKITWWWSFHVCCMSDFMDASTWFMPLMIVYKIRPCWNHSSFRIVMPPHQLHIKFMIIFLFPHTIITPSIDSSHPAEHATPWDWPQIVHGQRHGVHWSCKSGKTDEQVHGRASPCMAAGEYCADKSTRLSATDTCGAPGAGGAAVTPLGAAARAGAGDAGCCCGAGLDCPAFCSLSSFRRFERGETGVLSFTLERKGWARVPTSLLPTLFSSTSCAARFFRFMLWQVFWFVGPFVQNMLADGAKGMHVHGYHVTSMVWSCVCDKVCTGTHDRTSLTSPIFSALLFAARAAAAAMFLVKKNSLETKKCCQAQWLGLVLPDWKRKNKETYPRLRLATWYTFGIPATHWWREQFWAGGFLSSPEHHHSVLQTSSSLDMNIFCAWL